MKKIRIQIQSINKKKDIRKALKQIDSLKGEILELQKQNADLQIEAKKISIKKVIQWLKR